jgi:hypothetical protein
MINKIKQDMYKHINEIKQDRNKELDETNTIQINSWMT